MRSFEHAHKVTLPARTYTVVRLDGRSFSSYTRGLQTPFDARFADDMDAVGVALAAEAAGTVAAYVASDEISLLLTDFTAPTTQPWLGGVAAKLTSLTAALATAVFNERRRDLPGHRTALFDSRVFTVPSRLDAYGYLLWRQRDMRRNALSMAARAHFSHRQVQGLRGPALRAQLAASGVDFDSYPAAFRNGRLVARDEVVEVVEFTHSRTQVTSTLEVTRHPWRAAPAPDLDTDAGRDVLLPLLPAHPDDAGRSAD